ncbi:MAG: 50S ribosomal protein L30 [Nanoarchaeota archaeon]|nr:50S ribosomal protein L30 [Nanoarchaeota archaeon]MBU4033140.1 50S ribosomal protein L30 [Candidatus Thermoplasmatota archaeon]MBU4123948.1 50S ribosomal protein L30 [Nanoarchaeota archaeon]
MYVVIRIRGLVGLRYEITDTLNMLRLHRKMHCVISPENPAMLGMLRKVKDYITWGEISDDVLKLLVEKRGRKPGNKRLTEEDAKRVFDALKSTGIAPKDVVPLFRLTPPSKGFKHSIKQHFPKGEVGYRGEKINELLKRMI